MANAKRIFDAFELGERTMKNNNSGTIIADDELRYLATDLHEVYSRLNELSSQLEGGGIVQVRDVEPAVSMAVPKLRSAVAVLYAATKHDDDGDRPADASALNQNPLLI